jgi:hypothetical protein
LIIILAVLEPGVELGVRVEDEVVWPASSFLGKFLLNNELSILHNAPFPIPNEGFPIPIGPPYPESRYL